METTPIYTDKFNTTQGVFTYLLLSGLVKDVPLPTSGVPYYISAVRNSIDVNKSINIELSLSMIKDEVHQCGYSLSFAPPHLFDKYSDGRSEEVGNILKNLTLKDMEVVLVELAKERKKIGRLWNPPLTYPTKIEVGEDGTPTNIRTILQRKRKTNKQKHNKDE